MHRWMSIWGPWTGLILLAGCATEYGRTAEREFRATDYQIEPGPAQGRPDFDGRFESYLAYAMRHSPELEANFARWRAAVLRIDPARRLPEPRITYGYFIRSVETRVGPQNHRLSLSQAFPWPTELTAGADAQALTARAAEQRFEALATAIQQRVAIAFWKLWYVHRTHQLFLEQEGVLDSLTESIRARVESGGADLADLSQVQLRLERLRDHRAMHHEMMRRRSADLLAVIGAPPGTPTPVRDEPAEGVPAEAEDALLAAALAHPRVEAHERMAEASEAQARAANAKRYPDLMLGLDWTLTGSDPGGNTTAPGNGQDAVMASVSVSLPLWAGSYRDEVAAARADGVAQRADGEAARQQAAAELTQALSDVRDAQRRIRLYEEALLPQAETVYSSVSGGLVTGRASIAQVLMAEQDLLELQIELAEARTEHARAWADLERVVAHEVARRDPSEEAPEPVPDDEAEADGDDTEGVR